MLLNEIKLKKIIKNLLSEHFLLIEQAIDDKIKKEWITFLKLKNKINSDYFNSASADSNSQGNMCNSRFGAYAIANQADKGKAFFNDVFNDINVDELDLDIVNKNIDELYSFLFHHYINPNKANVKEFIDMFKNIKIHVKESNKMNLNLFISNVIKILEACKGINIWNDELIEEDIGIISTIDDISEITSTDQLTGRLNKNYPGEIIFSNLNSRNTHLAKLLSKKLNDNVIKEIVYRLKSTLNYRKKNKKM